MTEETDDDDDDDYDVYLDRITQHKPKNYLPYVKYRPARKGRKKKEEETEILDSTYVFFFIITQ
jgi:hypothetical protein